MTEEQTTTTLTSRYQQKLQSNSLFIKQAQEKIDLVMFYLGLTYLTDEQDSNSIIIKFRSFAQKQIEALISALLSTISFHEDMDAEYFRPKHIIAEKQKFPTTLRNDLYASENQIKLITESFTNYFDNLHSGNLYNTNNQPNLEKENPSLNSDDLTIGINLASLRTVCEKLSKSRINNLPKFKLFTYGLSYITSLINKHLSTIIILTTIGFLVFSIDIVGSIVLGEASYSLPIAAFLITPQIWVWWHRWANRQVETVPQWDVGGRLFRSYWPCIFEPAYEIVRWPLVATSEIEEPLSESDNKRFLGFDVMALKTVHEFIPPSEGITKLLTNAQTRKVKYFLLWCGVGLITCIILASNGIISDAAITVFLVLAIFSITILMASLLDFWEFFDPYPIRLMVLGIFGFLALQILFFTNGMHFLWVTWFAMAVIVWYLFKDAAPHINIVVVVLGVFAILNFIGFFTDKEETWKAENNLITKLDRIPTSDRTWPYPGTDPIVVIAASGGGSRAALFAGLTLEALNGVSDEDTTLVEKDTKLLKNISSNIHAISSVSGGSLANAAYIVRKYNDCNIGTLSKTVAGDFILPTLTGALIPFVNRASYVENSWAGNSSKKPCQNMTESVGLGDITLGDLVKKWKVSIKNKDNFPPFPMPLFNSATLDGHAVVLSPLENDFYINLDIRKNIALDYDISELTWVHNRDGIYGLEDILENFNPKLSSAVRASANFPFGFPLVEIETTQIPPFTMKISAKDKQQIFLTDGGTLSNSGVLPLANLLFDYSHEKKIRTEIRKRGLLLILIDASKMPEFPGSGQVQNLLGTISDQSPIGQRLHRSLIEHLSHIYGDKFKYWQINLSPNKKNNILTTWSLGTTNIKRLETDFQNQWLNYRCDLLSKWEALTGAKQLRTCKTRNGVSKLERIPLD